MIILLLILVIVMIAGSPLAAIWAVNTLFTLTIEYTLLNWFAAFILVGIVSGGLPHINWD